jgi:excisionase family DNA binding protein
VRIRDINAHPESYVTVAELAEYWLVGRKQIYKQINAGTLPAIRLGPRLMRINTADAIAFERRANLGRSAQRVTSSKRATKRSTPVARGRAGQK